MFETFMKDRKRKAAFDQLDRLLDERRLTLEAFMLFMNEMEKQPHVSYEPVGQREEENEQKVIMNNLHEATNKALQTYDSVYMASPYTKASASNCAANFGDIYGDDPAPDHCGICAVPKEQCHNHKAHFGERGESPPDNFCTKCGMDFGNRYGSGNALRLHQAGVSGGRCNEASFEANRRSRLRLPLHTKEELAEFERLREESEKQSKKGKGGASKKTKKA